MPTKRVYGKKLTATQIVRAGARARVPATGSKLVSLLNSKSPKNLSDPNSLK